MTKEQEEQEADWKRRMARAKALNTEADELACFLAFIDGYDEEGTPGRLECFKFVWSLPKYDHAARRHALSDPI